MVMVNPTLGVSFQFHANLHNYLEICIKLSLISIRIGKYVNAWIKYVIYVSVWGHIGKVWDQSPLKIRKEWRLIQQILVTYAHTNSNNDNDNDNNNNNTQYILLINFYQYLAKATKIQRPF